VHYSVFSHYFFLAFMKILQNVDRRMIKRKRTRKGGVDNSEGVMLHRDAHVNLRGDYRGDKPCNEIIL
jgi:hypothetical protein